MNLSSGLAYAIKKEEGLKWKLQVDARLIWSGSTLVDLSSYMLIQQKVYWLVLCVNLTQAGFFTEKGVSVGEVPP